jgi:23S rRNA (adenine2030-N6)-methyltransferase
LANEFELLERALRHGLRRFATGCYAIWYPIKDAEAVEKFLLAFSGLKSVRLELRIAPRAPGKLAACGMLVINPPWKFEETMGQALPWVAPVLDASATMVGADREGSTFSSSSRPGSSPTS